MATRFPTKHPYHLPASTAVLGGAIVALAGCRGQVGQSVLAQPTPTQHESAPIATPCPEWAAHMRIESNGGSYVVHVAPAPSALPDNESFELRVWIASSARPHELAPDVRLAVDASMPEHGHGMNRTPKIARAQSGEFVVQGMLFHMTGRWELYFDVTSGALTERAQADVILE